MLNITNMMVGTEDVKRLGEFYTKVFAKEPEMSEGEFYGWSLGGFFFSVGQHSEVHGKSKEPQRMILNMETEDVQGEFERLKEFAEVIKAPYQMGPEGNQAWIATLADPDGNYFQLMTPWKE